MSGNQNPTEAQKQDANVLKDEGNKFFTQGAYKEAIEKFTAAIELDGTNHIFFSNRSGSYLGSGDFASAQADARECIRINPKWSKGYSRLGAACMAAKDYAGAIAAFAGGIPHDPTNASLTEGIQAAQTAMTASSAPTVEEVTKEVSKMNVESENMTKELPEATEIIGIDLGTTNSCVAVWQEDRVEVIANSEGGRTTPSVVAFTDSERLIGAGAMSQAASNPTNTVFGAKRFIGRSIQEKNIAEDIKRLPYRVVPAEDGTNPLFEVTYRGETRKFSPQEISSMVLTKMKQTAETYLGKKVTKAVVTVPAYFNDAQRNATKTAGTIAGLDVRRIINEPTAAAIAYGLDKKLTEANSSASSPGYVLIFDLGGGTFDVSLLSIEEGIFEVKATGGDTELGGEDFDTALQEFAMAEFKKKHAKALKDLKDAGQSGDPATNKRAVRRLRTACERAKRHLSSTTQASIEVENFYEGLDLDVVITRAKFESLNEKFFKRCIDTVKQVMTDAKAKPTDVAEIVLVGGSTRIPKIQDMLSTYFNGKELCKSINPDEAVAVGAAIQGAVLGGSQSSATQALVLVDVAPLSLGIELEGRVMAVLIKRNTPIPVRKTKTFTTTEDYQTEVKVNVYEGERSIVDSNNLLGSFVISGIQMAKRGVPQVDVTFNIDANGILHVTARDQVTKANAEITITNSVGHNSPEEIERLVAEAERMKKEDEKIMARVEARNELESFVYMVKSNLDQYNNAALTNLVAETAAWLDEKDEEGASSVEVSEFETKRKAVETLFDKVTMEAQQAQAQANAGARNQRRRK